MQAIHELLGQEDTESRNMLQANIARILADALMFYTAKIDAPGNVTQVAPRTVQKLPHDDHRATDDAGLPMALHQLLVQHVLALLPALMDDADAMPLYAQKILASLLSR
jgi:hypothetical protein